MKFISISVFTILFTLTIYCQKNATGIRVYNIEKQFETDNTIVLKMSFGKYHIESIIGDTLLLHKADQVVVDLVYTDYPLLSDFKKLNDNRLQQLYIKFPFLKNNIKLNYLKQTDGNSPATARKMFHGIVIKYRQKQDAEVMKHDIQQLTKMLEDVDDGKSVDTLKIDRSSTFSYTVELTDSVFSNEFDEKKVKEPTRVVEDAAAEKDSIDTNMTVMKYFGLTNDTLMKWKEELAFKDADSTAMMSTPQAIKNGYIVKDNASYKNHEKLLVFFRREKKRDFLYSEEVAILAEDDMLSSDTGTFKKYNQLSDSTLFKVFARNKFKQFNVVGDVTGSMYPYTGQLLLWLKLNSLDSLTNNYTFFNDGDNKADAEKIIGKTGGIYSKKCGGFQQVKELVLTTMKNGGGGDFPENNIEALLLTEKEFPDADYQILIADNWAPIKDIELMKKLTKPVRIVLCGTSYDAVNIDYLNLALKTKGSVHLMEQDLYNLANLHEGEEVKIENRTYKIVGGKFIASGSTISGSL